MTVTIASASAAKPSCSGRSPFQSGVLMPKPQAGVLMPKPQAAEKS